MLWCDDNPKVDRLPGIIIYGRRRLVAVRAFGVGIARRDDKVIRALGERHLPGQRPGRDVELAKRVRAARGRAVVDRVLRHAASRVVGVLPHQRAVAHDLRGQHQRD